MSSIVPSKCPSTWHSEHHSSFNLFKVSISSWACWSCLFSLSISFSMSSSFSVASSFALIVFSGIMLSPIVSFSAAALKLLVYYKLIKFEAEFYYKSIYLITCYKLVHPYFYLNIIFPLELDLEIDLILEAYWWWWYSFL